MQKIILSIWLLAALTLAAIPPSNDNCANASSLVVGATCNYTNGTVSEATSSSTSSSCGYSVNSDVFYKFVASSSSVRVSVVSSASFDAVLEVFGSCGGSALICKDETFSGGTETISSLAVTSGNTYYVRVSDYSTSLPGTTAFSICITNAAIANESCANAISLTPGSGSCNSTIAFLGNTQSLAGCIGNANDDVWFSFTANSTQMIIEADGSFDEVIQAFSSCGGASIQCTDNNYLTLSTTIGVVYYFRVYDYYNTVMTNVPFSVCVYSYQSPVNDNCANALSIPASVGACSATTVGVTLGATQSLSGCAGTADDDTWFKFVANSTLMAVEVTWNADAVLEVFDACGGTSILCSNTKLIQLENLINGNTYYVRVYDYYNGYSGNNELQICAYSIPAVPNNQCANATVLLHGAAGDQTSATLFGAGSDGYASCYSGYEDDDVWFRFVATNANAGVALSNYDFDPIMEISSGCGTASFVCVNNSSTGISNLVIGDTYYIRVYSYSTAVATSFDIRLFIPVANDNCANAQTIPINSNTLHFDNANSTQSITSNACFGSYNDDVWFTYTPVVASGDTIDVLGASSFDAVIQLVSNCTGTNVACSDISGSAGLERIITAGLTPNQPYFIRVYHYYSSAPATPAFDISVKNRSLLASMETNDNLLEVSVFPVPAQQFLEIQSDAPIDRMQLISVDGFVVLETTEYVRTINTSAFPNGVYFLKLYSEDKLTVKKIIIGE